MIGGCAPRAPLSWSHSTRSWMPAEYSYTLASGRRLGPLLTDRRALLQVLRHPARDHVDAHPVQCVWLSDVWAGPSSHRTLGVMLRSTEASSKASEAIRTGSLSGRLSLQPAPVYSMVSKDYAAAVVSAQQVAQAATTLRCRQD
eukprot:XP_001705600.1 Hypothetical protein GL50803_30984 [Giardia lamblia ATCC 50803]